MEEGLFDDVYERVWRLDWEILFLRSMGYGEDGGLGCVTIMNRYLSSSTEITS